MGFDMADPICRELDFLRKSGEEEENKHDCKGCEKRIGLPCLRAYSCERLKKGEK